MFFKPQIWRVLITIILLILACLLGIPRDKSVQPLGEQLLPMVNSIFPSEIPYEFLPKPFPNVIGKNASGQSEIWITDSLDAAPNVIGYMGPVNVLVSIGSDGAILNIRILGHNETETFVRGINEPWFLDQFKGKTISSELKEGVDFDGITHATITVKAIAEGVRGCLSLTSIGSFKSHAQALPSNLSLGISFFVIILILFPLKPFIIKVFSFFGKVPKIFRALGVVGLWGFVFPQFLSIGHLRFFMSGCSFILSLPLKTLTILGVFIIGALLVPRGYCRFLCPMGQFQDTCRALSAKHGISGGTPQKADSNIGRFLFWAMMICAMVIPSFSIESVEIFGALFNLQFFDFFSSVFIGSVVLASFFVPRFYCRNLCLLNAAFQDLEIIRGNLPGKQTSQTEPQTDFSENV